MSEAFFRLLDATTQDGSSRATFAPTAHVTSPWGPDLQHGGPVAGLLTRAMDRLAPRPGTRLARISIDILGAVPVAEVRVEASIRRPGRRIELLTATLEARTADGGWRPAATASAWRLATQRTDDVARTGDETVGPAPDLDKRQPFALPPSWHPGGFVEAVTWHAARRGGPEGEATLAWLELGRPLVEGEETSGVEGLMTTADVANGVGARLDPTAFSFLNTDLVVTLFKEPRGPWFGVEAETSVGEDGVGMSSAVLHSDAGPIGRATQTLLVERR